MATSTKKSNRQKRKSRNAAKGKAKKVTTTSRKSKSSTKSKSTAPSSATEFTTDSRVQMLDRDSIIVDYESNPRGESEEAISKNITELKRSIKELGMLEPVGVVDQGDGTFKLDYGFRRITAWDKVSKKGDRVPALVHVQEDDRVNRLRGLAENSVDSRKAIENPIQEAKQYAAAMDDFAKEGWDNPLQRLCHITGASEKRVETLLGVLEAPDYIQNMVASGQLKPVAALELKEDDEFLESDVVSEIILRLPGKGTKARATDVKKARNKLMAELVAESEEDETKAAVKQDKKEEAVRPKKSEVMQCAYNLANNLMAEAENGNDLTLDLDNPEFQMGFLAGIGFTTEGWVADITAEDVKKATKEVKIRRYVDWSILQETLDVASEGEKFDKETEDYLQDLSVELSDNVKGKLSKKVEEMITAVTEAVEEVRAKKEEKKEEKAKAKKKDSGGKKGKKSKRSKK